MVKMLEAGVTCARVDLSWGTKQYHARSLTNLGEAMKQTRRLCRCVDAGGGGGGLAGGNAQGFGQWLADAGTRALLATHDLPTLLT